MLGVLHARGEKVSMPIDEYYTLGRTGLRVSRTALGAMIFGTPWGWAAPPLLMHGTPVGTT